MMDLDIELLQTLQSLNAPATAVQNTHSLIDAYLNTDERFFTKEKIMRQTVFLFAQNAQDLLRGKTNYSYELLSDAIGTHFELFDLLHSAHHDLFSQFNAARLMSTDFSLATALESIHLMLQYVELFFRAIRITHAKLDYVLQPKLRDGLKPWSVIVMATALQRVIEDYENMSSWYLDGLQDLEHATQGDLMEGKPHDDLTRDVDVHRKILELAHPPSLSFNLMIRIKKMYLETDPEFFTKEKKVRNARQVIVRLRETPLNSWIEKHEQEELSKSFIDSLNRVYGTYDSFYIVMYDFTPRRLVRPDVHLICDMLADLKNSPIAPDTHSCLSQVIMELKAFSALLRQLEGRVGPDGIDDPSFGDLCEKLHRYVESAESSHAPRLA